MTPTEYRQFCESTYCAPSTVDREEYLRLLLIEEFGEVASLFAKAMRDGHEVDRDRLLKELGDVMWAATMLGGSWTKRSHWPDYSHHPKVSPQKILASGKFYDFDVLIVMCGFDPEDVALANVEKLKSRQARGVLHGAGDER